jgi:hypothetical protein
VLFSNEFPLFYSQGCPVDHWIYSHYVDCLNSQPVCEDHKLCWSEFYPHMPAVNFKVMQPQANMFDYVTVIFHLVSSAVGNDLNGNKLRMTWKFT